MQKRTSFFILLFLSSLILLSFFSGCLPVTPVTVTGTVSGYVAIPDDTTKDLTGYSPVPGATVTIVDADGVTHTVLTDENGYYYFNNISIKTNTIINITKDTEGGGKLIFKDIVPLVVSQEEDYDAGIADAESTTIALVVEGLVNLGQVQEEIDLDEITSSDGFDKLKEDIQQAQEDNQDFTTDNTINTQAEEIADNIVNPPEPTPTPDPTPTPATPITDIAAITGTPQVGVELTAGALTPAGATATYQWTISDTVGGTYADISGATTNKYTPVADDATKFIKVVVTGTGNYSGSVTSDPTTAVAAADIATAGVTGFVAPVTGGTTQVFGGLTAGAATYTVTGLTWSPAHATFGGTTAYTATVELTSASGNKFPASGIAVPTANIGTVSAGVTSGGDVPGNKLSFTVLFPATATVVIGQSYGGGIVAYILSDNGDGADDPGYDANVQHGLIAAVADQSTSAGIIWALAANQAIAVTGTLLTIGSGSANTDKIITQNGAGTTYAAGLARAYNGGSYNDWFLPSKDELNKLWINRVAIGGFADYYYWSSSELNANYAWSHSFFIGYQGGSNKSLSLRVRAVRAF